MWERGERRQPGSLPARQDTTLGFRGAVDLLRILLVAFQRTDVAVIRVPIRLSYTSLWPVCVRGRTRLPPAGRQKWLHNETPLHADRDGFYDHIFAAGNLPCVRTLRWMHPLSPVPSVCIHALHASAWMLVASYTWWAELTHAGFRPLER